MYVEAMAGKSSEPGDPNAQFASLCRKQMPYLVRALRYFGVPERDVADVAQEVLLIVHRKLPEFEQRSTLRTWLYRICQRAASDYRRRAHVRRELVKAEPLAPETSAADAIAQLEARAQLIAALDVLDDDKRDVFVLFEIEQLDMHEVCEVLQCPLQTAYSRLHAARKLLLQRLQEAQRGVA